MYTLVRLYLLTSDIFDKLRQRHSTIRTLDSDTRIGIISLATESKRIVCNLPFENQLFGYIHYCTEISEININLLPNTCNFHRKFWFIFSLHLSENAQNVHFREARFQSFPDPPSALAPSALDTIFAGLTLNCFRRVCYFQSVILSIISHTVTLRMRANISANFVFLQEINDQVRLTKSKQGLR